MTNQEGTSMVKDGENEHRSQITKLKIFRLKLP